MIKKLLDLVHDRTFYIYALIGLTGVAIDFVLYLILVKLHVPPAIASLMSVGVAIVNNFFLNAYFNFKKHDHLLYRFLSFFAVGMLGALFSALFIFVINDLMGFNEIIAKVVSIPFVILFQYFFNKNASFAESGSTLPKRELAIFLVGLAFITAMIAIAPMGQFSDEYDNLLGGQFLANGGVLYQGYFSHHMPLPYFIAAPLFLVLGANLIGVKVLLGLAAGIWVLAMARHLLREYGLIFYTAFLGLIALSQFPQWSHMLLAESIIGLAAMHAVILLLVYGFKKATIGHFIILGVLAAVPALSSLSYAPISILIFVMAAVTWFKTGRKWKYAIALLAAAAIPYLLLLAYLLAFSLLSVFINQAVTFNKLYYSQFIADAPVSTVDSALSIFQLSTTDLFKALTFQRVYEMAIPALSFVFALFGLIVTFLLFKRNKLLGIFLGLFIFLGSSRGGYTPLFTATGGTRSSVVTFSVIIIAALYYVYIYLKDPVSKRTDLSKLGFSVAIALIGGTLLYCTALTTNQLRLTQRIHRFATLSPEPQPSSPIDIINRINGPNDYYWIAPLDFGSQLRINSKNASIYRFYAPWHAVCKECTDRVISDIRYNKPKVINIELNGQIWNQPVATYSKPLVDSFKPNYYQVEDPRLVHFFFLKRDKQSIDGILEKQGYDIKDKTDAPEQQ